MLAFTYTVDTGTFFKSLQTESHNQICVTYNHPPL